MRPDGDITGGLFGMVLNKAEPAYAIRAGFSDGFVEQTNAGDNCTNQKYRVNGSLDNVTVTGTGTLRVTLTHY